MTELLDSATERPTLTVQETAELLGISRWLVQQAVRRGDLPHVRIGRRILVPRARLLAFLAGDGDGDAATGGRAAATPNGAGAVRAS